MRSLLLCIVFDNLYVLFYKARFFFIIIVWKQQTIIVVINKDNNKLCYFLKIIMLTILLQSTTTSCFLLYILQTLHSYFIYIVRIYSAVSSDKLQMIGLSTISRNYYYHENNNYWKSAEVNCAVKLGFRKLLVYCACSQLELRPL